MPQQKNNNLSIGKYISGLTASFFLVAALVIVIFVNLTMKENALHDARTQARIILDRNLAVHTYFNNQLKPKLLAALAPRIADGYFEPTWMSSTYAIREINKYAKTLYEFHYYYKECAINARSVENEADPYERSFIRQLNLDPKLVEDSGVRSIDGLPYYVVLRRGETMEVSCLRCHGTAESAPAGLNAHYQGERSFGRQVNEVVSAISMRLPLAIPYREANQISLKLSSFFLLVLAGLYLLQHWLHKRLLFIPLHLVSRKAEQIASHPERLGETIALSHGKELFELTSAFNTLSLNLQTSLAEAQGKTTELQLVTEQIRKSQEEYRTLLWNIRVAVMVHGPDQRILTSNSLAEKLFDLTAEELPGKSPPDLDWQLLREDGSPLPAEEYPVTRAFATRQPVVDLIVGLDRRKLDNRLWLLVNADPILGPEGQIQQVIMTFVDISKRKRAETELRTLNNELGERVRARTEELEAKNLELGKINRLFVGRELRMSELKAQIAELESRLEPC